MGKVDVSLSTRSMYRILDPFELSSIAPVFCVIRASSIFSPILVRVVLTLAGLYTNKPKLVIASAREANPTIHLRKSIHTMILHSEILQLASKYNVFVLPPLEG